MTGSKHFPLRGFNPDDATVFNEYLPGRCLQLNLTPVLFDCVYQGASERSGPAQAHLSLSAARQ
jgi:hypothetical protein